MFTSALGFLFLILFVSSSFADSPLEIVKQPLHGLNFSPYWNQQSPYRGSVITPIQIRHRLRLIRPYTHWVRTFSSTGGLEMTGPIAHQLGLKTVLGAHISEDLRANDREVKALIEAAKSGHADMLVVGSEVLLRQDLPEARLLQYLERVKKAVPHIPVTYADVYGELLAHPKIMAACREVLFVNYYPYWEGKPVQQAMANLHAKHRLIQKVAKGKQVVVSETGWPSAGDTYGDAIPSSENAGFYLLNFVSWAKANSVDYFYFEAFDEEWKANDGKANLEAEAHWGIWDKYGNFKDAMKRVFNGELIADNWSGLKLAKNQFKKSRID